MHESPALSIPTTASTITVSWAETMLAASGHDSELRSIQVTPVGTGQMATSLRVTPEYLVQADAPDSFVVKIASEDPNSRQAGARGAYLREVRFYQQLADDLPVATPRSLWAAIDVETNDFAIVLEDMAPAVQGDQIQGATPESVIAAAENIAGLHAPSWCDERLFAIDWLSSDPHDRQAGAAEIKAIITMVMPGFLARYDDRLDELQREQLAWFAANVDTWLLDDRGIFALTHGDHRLDNLLFGPAQSAQPVTVVDWQTLAVRNPVADISYLLGTSLDDHVRREIEEEVVHRYHDQLLAHGVAGYDFDRCFDDYRTQSPHSMLLTVLGSMLTIQTDRGDDMFMAMLRRSSRQLVDLDVL